MKIKSLHIKNFKSLVDLEIVEPNPFTVFVGANGVGKSNIFEALEFNSSSTSIAGQFQRVFGSKQDILSRNSSNDIIEIAIVLDPVGTFATTLDLGEKPTWSKGLGNDHDLQNGEHNNIDNFWSTRFSRIFIGNRKELKIIYRDDLVLLLDGSNLEKVLKRLLLDESTREEITEYLQLLIPGFDNVEIQSSELSGTNTLLIYEKGLKRPFTKNLISDGTYNILCLLTAIYQSDEPQFLCIEEPENGLTPYAIDVLVDLIRDKCLENGHYIWLNTHSQTLVRHLKEEELILVDKVEGATKIKQFNKGDFYGLQADEAWLTNALGAGLPW